MVLRDAYAVVVGAAEVGLCVGVPLVGGLPVPACALRVVLRDAYAVVVGAAEVGLCVGVPLLSSIPQGGHVLCLHSRQGVAGAAYRLGLDSGCGSAFLLPYLQTKN